MAPWNSGIGMAAVLLAPLYVMMMMVGDIPYCLGYLKRPGSISYGAPPTNNKGEDDNMINNAEVREVLIQARALISKRERWTRRSFVSVTPGMVVSYCAVGALYHGTYGFPVSVRDYAVQLLALEVRGSVIDFNDSHSHEEVLALFDEVIAKLTPPSTVVSTEAEVACDFVLRDGSIVSKSSVVPTWYDVPVELVDV